MKIYNRNGKELLDVEVNDNSYRYRSIMQGETVTLYYSLTNHIEIPIGSYIILPSGERYTLCKPENFSKQGTRNFEYTVVFDGELEQLKRYKYKFITYDLTNNIETFELKFSITDKPHRFIELLVENLNLYNKPSSPDDKWEVGECIDAVEKNISFNHDNCYNALSRVASEFNTEWEIDGKTIHLRKVEKFKETPLPLSYGKGKGFKTGVGRQSQGDKPPVTRLFVQGGERNITFDSYGSKTLHLPINAELSFENRKYRTDSQGLYIMRADRIPDDINEDSYDASHIYPKWIGEVTDMLESENANLFIFKIKDPAQQPDFRFTRLPNEKATIIFQSGKLMGREFDLTQNEYEILQYSHQEGIFTAIKQKEGEQSIPNSSLPLSVGDKFAIFNINMPQEYICDDSNKKGASWDMFREAVRYMFDNEEEQFCFTGELDGIWAKKRWSNIGAHIIPGGYIEFSDTQFQPEGIRIRITGVKDYINNPHSPEIELSNVPVPGTVSDDLGKIEAKEIFFENRHKDSIQYTKRRWYDAIETMGMLEEAIDGFEEGIKPIWVQAMSVLVGDESLQFKFANSHDWEQTIEPNFIYVQDEKQLRITYPQYTSLVHLTLGGKTMSPSPDESNYRTWPLKGDEYLSAKLTSPNPYYLYIKCPDSGEGYAEFELSLKAHSLQENRFYYFLAGTLGSEYMGERSFVTVYGFTEILPGRITVDRIISPDGVHYWDMAHKAFRIGDENNYLGYNVNQDGKLILKGTLVQSPSGDIDYLETDRGNWINNTTYYPGDKVRYSNGNIYKCVKQNTNELPTNSTYWRVLVTKGDKGEDGDNAITFEYIYYATDNENFSSIPESLQRDKYIPYDWSPQPDLGKYTYLYISQRSKESGWWSEWSYPTLFSTKGKNGRMFTYRGEFDEDKDYLGDENVAEVVFNRSESNYYYTAANAGVFSGRKYPPGSGKWVEYGATFESVATDLLFADQALIAGWNFSKDWIWSKDSTVVLNGNDAHKFGEDLPVIIVGDQAIFDDKNPNKEAALKIWRDGTITIGSGNGYTTAGMSGVGNSPDSIRFWAGNQNPQEAPFKVFQNGNARIGGLNFDSGGIYSDYNVYDRYNDSRFFLSSHGDGSIGFSSSELFAALGLNVLSATTGTRALLRLENRDSSNFEFTKYNAYIITEGAYESNVHLFMSGGWSNNMSFESTQFGNDPNGYFRSCIKLSNPPSINQIGERDTQYKVMWDEETGYLFIK